ncbi:MAG: energy-coupling factor ABC transporter permease [Geminicoccaceae bacterium]
MAPRPPSKPGRSSGCGRPTCRSPPTDRAPWRISPTGVLSLPVILGGTAAGCVGVAIGLRRLDERLIARTAILAAAFFVLSLVLDPARPDERAPPAHHAHGPRHRLGGFPAVLVGLVLQLVLAGVGGLTTLGINTLDIALPGVLVGALLRNFVARAAPGPAMLAAGLGAALAVALTTLGVALALTLSGEGLAGAAPLVGFANLPLMLVEGVVTAFAVGFLKKVRPELLAPSAALAA